MVQISEKAYRQYLSTERRLAREQLKKKPKKPVKPWRPRKPDDWDSAFRSGVRDIGPRIARAVEQIKKLHEFEKLQPEGPVTKPRTVEFQQMLEIIKAALPTLEQLSKELSRLDHADRTIRGVSDETSREPPVPLFAAHEIGGPLLDSDGVPS